MFSNFITFNGYFRELTPNFRGLPYCKLLFQPFSRAVKRKNSANVTEIRQGFNMRRICLDEILNKY